jgi:hypothetical protein
MIFIYFSCFKILDEDLEDYKIPTRDDIKAKSLRIFQQGIIKRGILSVAPTAHRHRHRQRKMSTFDHK